MDRNKPKVVRNTRRIPCSNCGGEHEFFSRASKDARCGTPVAFSLEVARGLAMEHADGEKSVEEVPAGEETMIVILDDSARKLPSGRQSGLLDQGVQSFTFVPV